jgi:hypothetical protein
MRDLTPALIHITISAAIAIACYAALAWHERRYKRRLSLADLIFRRKVEDYARLRAWSREMERKEAAARGQWSKTIRPLPPPKPTPRGARY